MKAKPMKFAAPCARERLTEYDEARLPTVRKEVPPRPKAVSQDRSQIEVD